jgi:hypothetical protein
MTQLPDDLTRGPRRLGSDDAIITARQQGAAIERQRIVAEIRAFVKEITRGVPRPVDMGVAEITNDLIDRINALPEKGE